MKIAGIDSCPLGWVVIIHDGSKFRFEAVKSIDELIGMHPDLQRIFIDIPIGLSSEKFTRTIESKLRKELGKRSSTIFTPACRKAIYTENYKEAREINKEILGKSISIQSYNISRKIKEIDLFMQTKSKKLEIYESHPEICFKYLNDAEVIQSKKSTQDGFLERYRLLQHHHSQLQSIFQSMAETFLKSKVKPDDILDAMVLCVSNLKGNDTTIGFIEDNNNLDEKGIVVKVAY